MGRRSINTTKSGKYMNPTDQARKEARKRELKKNKKQRMLVRTAVLKGKDPVKLLEEMEIIDQMEFNPMEAPKLNEKVLKDKRKKLKETFVRVCRLYEKENPEYCKELKKAETDYEKTRDRLQTHYEQVKNAERVQLNEIPLPDMPIETAPAMIPLPSDIPLPHQTKSILKKTSAYSDGMVPAPPMERRKKKPPGPPPGPPPDLSDSEPEEEELEEEEYDPAKGVHEVIGTVEVEDHPEEMETDLSEIHPPPEHNLQDVDQRDKRPKKIRFVDDDTHDPEEEEKDTRLMFPKPKAPPVTSLQKKMLELAGQLVPKLEEEPQDEDLRIRDDRRDRDDRQDEDLRIRDSRRDRDDRRYRDERRERDGRRNRDVSERQDVDERRDIDERFDRDGRRDRDERRDDRLDRRDRDDRLGRQDRDERRRRDDSSSSSDSDDDEDEDMRRKRRVDSDSSSDSEDETFAAHRDDSDEDEREKRPEKVHENKPAPLITAPLIRPLIPPGPPPGAPAGLPPGLPPGPPPGAPPMMMRPPPLRGGPPGAPPRMIRPGPPPGRPQGMPPGPPPGLPPNVRLPPRLPPGGPPGMPPPRMMRPPGGPPGVLPLGLPPAAAGVSAPPSLNPNVLSAPPSIMKLPQKAPEEKESGATISAKPQIKNVMGDVTRFTPTALKVKRTSKDARLKKNTKEEDKRSLGMVPKPAPVAQQQGKRKDDAYDQFMKEMENLL